MLSISDQHCDEKSLVKSKRFANFNFVAKTNYPIDRTRENLHKIIFTFRFMDTIPEVKMIFMQLIITKSHMDTEKFHIEQDNTGIHCHNVSKMKILHQV